MNRKNIPTTRRLRKMILERNKINAANFLDHLAELFGDRTIALLEEKTPYGFLSADELGYDNLLEIVNRMGNSLRQLGIRSGDRVVLYMRNRLELALASYAVFKIGAVANPLNHLLRGNEVDFIVRDCDAETLITHRSVFDAGIKSFDKIPQVKQWIFHEQADNTPEGGVAWLEKLDEAAPYLVASHVEPDDVVGIFYTSGTTGFPKGALMTSENLMVNNIRMPGLLTSFAPAKKRNRDVGMAVQPISHIMGFGLFLMRLAMGVPFVVMERFDPEKVMEAIQKHGVTMFVGVPAMYAMMNKAGAGSKYDLSSVRIWISGSDVLPPEQRDAFKKYGRFHLLGRALGDAMFFEGYGQAETSPISTIKPDLPITRGAGCIGWPLPGVKIRIVDENGEDVKRGQVGELWVQGKHVMKGYWRDEKASREAFQEGWFRTGDLVKRDKFGLLYLVDREKDVIKVGGYSVFSREVEEEVLQHPDVREAAVFGVPDEIKGQLPVAIVTIEEGSETTPEELMEWARENIAPYKVPRLIDVVPELPRGPTLKVDKKLLRNRYAQLLSEQSREKGKGEEPA